MDPIVIILIVLSIIVLGGLCYYFLISKKKNTGIKENSLKEENEVITKQEEIKVPEVIIEKTPEKQILEAIKNEILISKQEELLQANEEVQTNISIASKTEKALLKKLELFEKNKGFIKKDVNLTSLSKQFETNTKYLSEIIKTHRQKQFNTYLNELRIAYIVNRLQNEPKYINTKVSYLASDCGFTSHSTFTTIFTQIMDESPSVFVKRIKAEQNI